MCLAPLTAVLASIVLSASLFAQAPSAPLPPPQTRTQTVTQTVTVTAQTPSQPDPASNSYRSEELLPATPGRPGVPFSIPGLPSETASGGIKAPQYFAPGVAGDHGEPVAQFLDLDGFLIPNNLTANAHGNGYADPNLLIAPTLEGVTADSGAFNARYGDHAINVAVAYILRTRLLPFLQFSTDSRDADLAATWSPRNSNRQWLAAEFLWGNGWLQRPEHRQQLRLAALRQWTPGHHTLTLLGIGYEGFSHLPGLIPLDRRTPGETIDPRQQDSTHTELAALTDSWDPHTGTSLKLGVFARRYGLDLRSNFGDGLIRQSERRWVAGGSATLLQSVRFMPRSGDWTLIATTGYTVEAPRDLRLEHVIDAPGALSVPGDTVAPAPLRFDPVTRNNLTLQTPFAAAALNGRPLPALRLYAGARVDHVCFRNRDLLSPADSFDRCVSIASPKLTATLGRRDRSSLLPEVSLSYAHAFHANDPRIGATTPTPDPGSLVISAHEWQAVVRQRLSDSTELRLVLARVANAGELAKIDADTGLQQNVGPAINRYVTLGLTHRRSWLFWQATWSAADARDRADGSPIPEAPRLIADSSATLPRLPHGLSAQAEFEYVKAKPLGDSINGLPLSELRLSLRRTWLHERLSTGLQGQLAQGFTGQTTETLALPGELNPTERPAGVPSSSYASATISWTLR